MLMRRAMLLAGLAGLAMLGCGNGPADAQNFTKQVHIIVFHALVGRESICDQAGPDVMYLVGDNTGSYTAATYGNASFHFSVAYGSCKWNNEIRIVIKGIKFIGAKVCHLMPQ